MVRNGHVRRSRAVSPAYRASHRVGHASANRLDLESVLLAAPALDLYWNHAVTSFEVAQRLCYLCT